MSSASFSCSLYATIEHQNLSKLIDRLIGLCNKLDFDYTVNLNEHELVFKPIVETPFGPSRNNDVLLRLKASYMDNEGQFVKLKYRKWKLFHYGPPEIEKPGLALANYRSVYDVDLDGDPFLFLRLLGYKPSFEFVKRGYMFTLNSISIRIFRVHKITEQFKISSAVFESVDPWMVECEQNNVSADLVLFTSNELFTLASYLKGIIELARVDHSILQTKIKYESN